MRIVLENKVRLGKKSLLRLLNGDVMPDEDFSAIARVPVERNGRGKQRHASMYIMKIYACQGIKPRELGGPKKEGGPKAALSFLTTGEVLVVVALDASEPAGDVLSVLPNLVFGPFDDKEEVARSPALVLLELVLEPRLVHVAAGLIGQAPAQQGAGGKLKSRAHVWGGLALGLEPRYAAQGPSRGRRP